MKCLFININGNVAISRYIDLGNKKYFVAVPTNPLEAKESITTIIESDEETKVVDKILNYIKKSFGGTIEIQHSQITEITIIKTKTADGFVLSYSPTSVKYLRLPIDRMIFNNDYFNYFSNNDVDATNHFIESTMLMTQKNLNDRGFSFKVISSS